MREVEEAVTVSLEAGEVLGLGQVEEGLTHELAADVVDGGREVLVADGLGDLGEGGAHGGGAGHVGGDAVGGAVAEGVDLGDDRVVGGGGAGKEEDCGVGRGEFEGEGAAWWGGVSGGGGRQW